MSHTRLRPAFTFTEEKLAELKHIAPEAFADGKVNWEVLKEALGEHVDDEGTDAEHFGLNWPGKRDARRMAGTPSTGALMPKPGDGVHEDSTRNIFIEGENLEVLKLLQKAYRGKVKMIYIDPPYNTGNDFVYEDDFTEPLEEYLRRTGQVDEEGRKLTTNTRADGRFHSKWLSMMLPRLRLARELLREDGVIYASIDDNEVNNLKSLMNEVFGEENFIAQLVWSGGRKNDSKWISISHEYVLTYVRNKEFLNTEKIIWRDRKEGLEDIYKVYEELKKVHKKDVESIQEGLKKWYKELPKDHPAAAHSHYNKVDERGIFFSADISWPGGGGPKYPVLHPESKKPVRVPSRGWMFSTTERMNEIIALGNVHFGADESSVPTLKAYLKDKEEQVPYSVFYQDGRASTKRLRALMGDDYFEHPKDETVLKKLLGISSSHDDIILDFFAGSGTTAHAVSLLNQEDGGRRQFILVQLPEMLDDDHIGRKKGFKTIADISRERIRRVMKADKQKPGFAAFALHNSNYRAWKDYQGTDAKALEDLFAAQEAPLREGWTVEGLTTEVMLLEGFPLDSRIDVQEQFRKNTVQRIHHAWHQHALFVCLDKQVHAETIAALVLGEGDVFICLDTAIDDQSKLRLSDKGMIKTI